MNERIDLIKDLKPGIKSINLIVIVLESNKLLTKDNHDLRIFKMADKTGSVNVCIYDEPGSYLQAGDICRLSRCYTSMFKNELTVYVGKGGKVIKTGDFCMTFSEIPNMSEAEKIPETPSPYFMNQ
ncbi:SOSS complex subunit B1 [Sarcoptes scabiei]|nr:SOSS complex subunit B1 [Sarcoptes scabiei]